MFPNAWWNYVPRHVLVTASIMLRRARMTKFSVLHKLDVPSIAVRG